MCNTVTKGCIARKESANPTVFYSLIDRVAYQGKKVDDCTLAKPLTHAALSLRISQRYFPMCLRSLLHGFFSFLSGRIKFDPKQFQADGI